MKAQQPEPTDRIKTLVKADKLIKAVLGTPGMQLKHYQSLTGIEVTGCFKLLKSLDELGYVEKKDKSYYPGSIFVNYSKSRIEFEKEFK